MTSSTTHAAVIPPAEPHLGWPAAELVPPVLSGRALRYVLVDLMMRQPEATVAELSAGVEAHGYRLGGRASKVISDALRWECRRGRVRRLRRGVYTYVGASRSTRRRIKLLARRSQAWLRAAATGVALPDPPQNRRISPGLTPDMIQLLGLQLSPGDPPWLHLGWLWSR